MDLLFILFVTLPFGVKTNLEITEKIDFHLKKMIFKEKIGREIGENLRFTEFSNHIPVKASLHNVFYSSNIESTTESINKTLRLMLSKQRSSEFDQKLKDTTRTNLTLTLASYGLKIFTQDFVVKSIRNKSLSGQNIIAILPGKNRENLNDVITVVGAHYDTVPECPGVDDNGSGTVAVLEIARVLSSRRSEFNDTLIFVLFDLEEWGALGSLAFVEHYLIPRELLPKRKKFRAAFVLDMLLNYDTKPETQFIPDDVKELIPKSVDLIAQNENRGNFLTVWMRQQFDEELVEYIKEFWSNEYKLVIMDPQIPASNISLVDIQKYQTFLRSDHASFWIHTNGDHHLPLKAVLLTDMGPWRGYQRMCYHYWCDDESRLTAENLAFVKNTIDVLIDVVINHC